MVDRMVSTTTTTDLGEISAELDRRLRRTIWCAFTTVDARNRPRTRLVHPVWNGATGWLTTRTGTPKLDDIRANTAVSCFWWDPNHEQVTIDAHATVALSQAERQRGWDECAAPPEPYGFDPATIFPDGPSDPGLTIVRLDATRIELWGVPKQVWRPPAAVPAPAV